MKIPNIKIEVKEINDAIYAHYVIWFFTYNGKIYCNGMRFYYSKDFQEKDAKEWAKRNAILTFNLINKNKYEKNNWWRKFLRPEMRQLKYTKAQIWWIINEISYMGNATSIKSKNDLPNTIGFDELSNYL